MSAWDAQRYTRFLNERTQAAVDLVRRVELPDDDVRRVADLGCGPGNSTEVIAARWPALGHAPGTLLCGVDNSETMLAEARTRHPHLRFAHQDVSDFSLAGLAAALGDVAAGAAPLDLVVSNATHHWIAHHERVFPQLMGCLRPGGVLAVQMPRNFDAPSHRLLHTAALDERWRARLAAVRKDRDVSPVHAPGDYYDWLTPLSSRVTLWETEYIQVVDSADDVGEFVRTTGARPFLDALERAQQPQFLAEYKRLLAQAYRPQRDGRVLFPFRRFFLLAVRK